MIGIEQLSFDPTDADTRAAGSNVGAYLRAGTDGDLISSTLIGGKEALDVNIANTLDIAVDLDHTEDSIRLGDGTSFFTSTSENGDIALDVHLSNTSIAVTDNGGSLTVDAVDLDIRDLTAASDSVSSWLADGAGTALTSTLIGSDQALDVNIANTTVSIDDNGGSITVDGTVSISGDVNVTQGTSPWVIGDGGGSITVDATDLDIRDLTHASDSIRLGDGTSLITSTLVGSDQGLDVNIINDLTVSDLADTAILNTQKNVTTTSGVLLASEQANRKYFYVQNLGTKKTYIGASGVTTANGLRLSPGAVAEFRLGPALSMHAVAEAGTQDCRVMELS